MNLDFSLSQVIGLIAYFLDYIKVYGLSLKFIIVTFIFIELGADLFLFTVQQIAGISFSLDKQVDIKNSEYLAESQPRRGTSQARNVE